MALFSKKRPDPPRRQRAAEKAQERATESGLEERYAFRRNRTITGSASSQVAATSEGIAQLKSPRVQAHELAQQRRHIGGVLLLVVAGIMVLAGLISQFTAGVTVKTSELSQQLGPSYAAAVQSYFGAQPLQRLRFLTDTQQLSSYVQEKVPEVAAVTMEGSAGFGKTSFVLTMRKPIAGWSINGRQQYVDATGTAFERNYFERPNVQIVDESGVRVEAGQAVASNRFLGFVGRAVGAAKKAGYTVSKVIIPRGTTRQVQLQLNGVRYPVKLSIDRGAAVQVEDMVRAVRWLRAHNVTPKYLDVRVSGEAFYR